MRSIDDITNFIFMEDQVEKADLIVVPGSLSSQTLVKASDLYQKGYADKILVSGAFSKDKGRFEWEKIKREDFKGIFETEAQYMKTSLIKLGVRGEDILVEDKSTYTYENALFSKALLEEKDIFPKSIILVAKDYHTRRCFMYFDKVFAGINIIVVSAKIDLVSKENWMKSELGLRVVLREFGKIEKQFQSIYTKILDEEIDSLRK